MAERREKHYTLAEEIANAVTHGVGVVFAVVALVLLVVYASFGGDAWRIVSASIFGSALVLLYLASTLYHALPQPSIKRIMRVFDHGAIYVLIAGTYTPFLLGDMRGPWGWVLFGVLWGAAVAGIIFKFFCIGRFDFVATLLYVAMGWTAIVAIKPALTMLPPGALVLLLIGGLLYTSGVVFYLWDRLPYNHAIWHLFVLGGSALHFAAVLAFAV
ncbi:MAG TPA: hemolysin III family protein [Candidatus Hydrogenedentes bacterium]|nr:hemolysin III family protein [Candidatus Hydrogenedentota bacterium]